MQGKIWIVVKSEFLRRIKSKWFILSTLLGPIVLIGLMVVPPIVSVMASKATVRTIAVSDQTGRLMHQLLAAKHDQVHFVSSDAPTDTLTADVRRGTYDGFLILPAGLLTGEAEATYYSVEGGGLTFGGDLQNMVDSAVDEVRLADEKAPPEVLEILRTKVNVRLLKITEQGTTADATAASSAIGIAMGFIIYVAMFIYGAFVMHGVLEEKQSRVLEVVVSSVRPFDLLMGKVIGIGSMGLVQMGAWVLILIAVTLSAGNIAALFLNPASFNLPASASTDELLAAADFAVPQLSISAFVWFLLFFLGGYLLYSSFFAAIGASVDQPQDAQGLMIPVTLLIITPMLFISLVVEGPNTNLAVILSLIPFFAPILMVVRVAVTVVPFWQVSLSFVLVILMFIGSIWVSSRIYRVGILMYGKKPSLRDLARWVRYA